MQPVDKTSIDIDPSALQPQEAAPTAVADSDDEVRVLEGTKVYKSATDSRGKGRCM